MIEIFFKSKKDACYIYKQLINTIHQSKTISLCGEGHIVQINRSLLIDEMTIIINIFTQFIFNRKQDEWIRGILQERFMYCEEEEREQILTIFHSIFIIDKGEQTEVANAIYAVLKEHVSFSFDSFVQFRLRNFLDQLLEKTEYAIDEYKMEQEYQIFIQTLREFIHSREAKLDILHLYYDNGFTFYNEYLVQIKRSELVRLIDRKLIGDHPVYIDSVTIAPLISIAPKQIIIYSDITEEPLITTILNIFEERVIIFPKKYFRDNQNKSYQIGT